MAPDAGVEEEEEEVAEEETLEAEVILIPV